MNSTCSVEFTFGSRDVQIFLELACKPDLATQDPPTREIDDKHHHHQHERGAPRLFLKILVGSERVSEHNERQRCHGMRRIEAQKWIAEAGEQNGRGLAGGTRDREQSTRDDTRCSGWKDELE